MHFRPVVRLVALVVGLLVLVAAAEAAHARRVDATWGENLPVKSRSQALGDAFATAVTDEALGILPGTLPDARRLALREYLAGMANELIRNYADKGIEQVPGVGSRLMVDVDVNRDLVKERLKEIGIFHTMEASVPYALQLTGADGSATERVSRLELVTGLERKPTATLRLAVRNTKGAWSAVLSGDENYSGQGQSLDEAWRNVWRQYFSGRLAKASAQGEAQLLRVWGWHGADGVEALDRALRDWVGAVESPALDNVAMRPDGVAATWSVRLLSRSELEKRLGEYAKTRKLRFELVAP